MPDHPRAAAAGGAFYIPSLDGIRAMAVLLVFAAHAGLNDKVPGSFGVTAFFFLSGFLITTLLRMEFERTGALDLRNFYLRRVLRIFPPMYLVLAVASALTAAGLLASSVQPDALLAQILHLSNYYIVFHGWWDGRAPGTWIYWSLAVEEHFYLLFPVCYLLLRRSGASNRRQLVFLLGGCLAVLAWRLVLVVFLGAQHDRTYVSTDTRFDSLLFGCALAVYGNPVLDPTRISDRVWKAVLFPLGLGALLVSFLVPGAFFEQTFRYTVQGLALIPLFVAAVRFPSWGVVRLLNLRWIKYIGVLSYSMYLMHPTILFAIDEWTKWPRLLQGAVALVLTIVLSALIHHYIEKPCAHLRRRLSHVFAPPSQPGVAARSHREPRGSAAPTYAAVPRVAAVNSTRNQLVTNDNRLA